MSDIKKFLTDDKMSQTELEEVKQKLKVLNDEFLDMVPEIKNEAQLLKDGEVGTLEARMIKVAMPPVFWRSIDKFTELFETTELMGAGMGQKLEDVQIKLIAQFCEKGDLELKEVLLSQVLIDSAMAFAKDAVRIELMIRLKEAMQSRDATKMLEIIESMKELSLEPVSDDGGSDTGN